MISSFGLARGDQLAEAVVLVPQLAVDQRTVEELNGHPQVRIAGPLAGADRLPLGLAKDLQELVLGQIRRGKLRGPVPWAASRQMSRAGRSACQIASSNCSADSSRG